MVIHNWMITRGVPPWLPMTLETSKWMVNRNQWIFEYWLVVWNIFFPHIWNNHPNWLSYFSGGLKPPTSKNTTMILMITITFDHFFFLSRLPLNPLRFIIIIINKKHHQKGPGTATYGRSKKPSRATNQKGPGSLQCPRATWNRVGGTTKSPKTFLKLTLKLCPVNNNFKKKRSTPLKFTLACNNQRALGSRNCS